MKKVSKAEWNSYSKKQKWNKKNPGESDVYKRLCNDSSASASDPLFSEKEVAEIEVDSLDKNLDIPEDEDIQLINSVCDFIKDNNLPVDLASYDGFRELMNELDFLDLSRSQSESLMNFLKDNETGFSLDDLASISLSEDGQTLVVQYLNSEDEFMLMNEDSALEFSCTVYADYAQNARKVKPEEALAFMEDYMGVYSASNDYVFRWGV